MLIRVVSTNNWRSGTSRVGDGQSVVAAVRSPGAVSGRHGGGQTIGTLQHHRVVIYTQLTHIGVGLTEGVGAGVWVSAGGVGGNDGVGVVGAGGAPTTNGEHTANSK